MNKLKIYDISFCETDANANVRGGSDDYLTVKYKSIRALPIFSKILEKIDFKDKGDFLVKESVSPEGDVYSYEGVSKDGKSTFGGGLVVDSGTRVAQAFSSSGSFKDL